MDFQGPFCSSLVYWSVFLQDLLLPQGLGSSAPPQCYCVIMKTSSNPWELSMGLPNSFCTFLLWWLKNWVWALYLQCMVSFLRLLDSSILLATAFICLCAIASRIMRVSIVCILLKFWRNPDVISSLVAYFNELSYCGTIFRWNKSLPILCCSWKLPSSPCSPSWFHSVRKGMKGTLIQVILHWAYLTQHTDVCRLNWILQGFLLEKCFLVGSLELSWFLLKSFCLLYGKESRKVQGEQTSPQN